MVLCNQLHGHEGRSETASPLLIVGVVFTRFVFPTGFMTLYVLSSTAPKNPFLDAVTISGTPLSCKSLDRNPSQVSGTVLRYFDDSISRPEDVPVSWYQGDRMVIGIKFFQFPQSPSLKLRCGVTRSTDLGDIKIFADVTTKKVGMLLSPTELHI